MYQPGTGYTALYSLSDPNWLVVTVIRPSPFNSVLILGQVDSTYLQIWLQLTGYRVFKSPDQFTSYTALFSPKPVAEWSPQPLVTEPAGKVPAIQPCFTKTGYIVYPPSPFNSSGRCGSIYKNYFNRLRKYRPVAVNSWVTPAYQFCRLQTITGYRKLPVTETWYLTELPKVILVTEILRPISGLDMAISKATTRQPCLITPLTSL